MHQPKIGLPPKLGGSGSRLVLHATNKQKNCNSDIVNVMDREMTNDRSRLLARKAPYKAKATPLEEIAEKVPKRSPKKRGLGSKKPPIPKEKRAPSKYMQEIIKR